MTENDFYGNPGSVYLVVCDLKCETNNKKLEGVGIFSETSSICKAAYF